MTVTDGANVIMVADNETAEWTDTATSALPFALRGGGLQAADGRAHAIQ